MKENVSKLRIGVLIEVRDGVHDENMPPMDRSGLVIGRDGWDEWRVLFSNGHMLKFHSEQLEVTSVPG
jgi:hypothetical protein